MNSNGRHFPAGHIIKPPVVKFEFDENHFRGMVKHVHGTAENSGGAIPMPDPASLMALGLVMDKLNDISARLAKLEAAVSPPPMRDTP